MRKTPLLFCTVFLAAAVGAWASDGEIQITAGLLGSSSAGEECDFWRLKWNNGQGNQPFGSCQPPILNVYAQLSGASASGVTGVEFAAQIGDDNGADAGYFLVEIPNQTATTLLGRAFVPPDPTPRGMNISWNTCQSAGGRVLISTVIVFPTAGCGPSERPPKLTFSGAQHAAPSNIFFRCPLFTLCDGPVFTKVCLGTNIVDCQTQVPPFPIASKCSTSGLFTINPGGSVGVGQCNINKNVHPPALVRADTWSNVKSLYR